MLSMSTTEAQSSPDDYEQRFLELVVHAHAIGGLFDRMLIVSGNDQPQARDDMPAGMLFELAHLSRLQLDAACHDLTDPWLSHAAPTHLRPLLEGMSQVAFILGYETDSPIGTSQQRATCLAVARVREEHEAMVAASPESVPAGNIEEGRQRVVIFEELHERVGCPYQKDPRDWACRNEDGKPCDHRSAWPCRIQPAAARKLTSPTIRRLSKLMAFRFRDIEVASSLVLHMLLADRLMVDAGDGTNRFANASYVSRASTLALALLSACGVTLAWAMETVSPPASQQVRDYMSEMWKKPDMIEIGTGAWDRPVATDA